MPTFYLEQEVPIQALESAIIAAAMNMNWQVRTRFEDNNRKYIVRSLPSGYQIFNVYIPNNKENLRYFSIMEIICFN